jgi:alcohol dehydrogenase
VSKLRIIAPVGRCFSAEETFSGPGSVSVLAGLPANRVTIIVSGSFWLGNENRIRIEKALRRFQVQTLISPGGEPLFSEAAKMSLQISDHKPEYIIAIGGGSTIDYSKLSWLLYEHPDLEPQNLSRPFSAPKLRGKSKFIAIPTTAGTGSEASSAAVYQIDSQASKNFIVTHDFLPDIAILDPNFTSNCPKSVKVSAGLDALSHAIEGYVSLFKNNQTGDLAEMAIRILLKSLPRYVDSDDVELSGDVLRASHWAGIVQNISIPGIGHAFAHQMSKVDIGHGAACGFFLPMAMRINCEKKSVRAAYNKLATNLGLDNALGLIASVEKLNLLLGNSVSKCKLDKVLGMEDFEMGVMTDPTGRANPVTLTPEVIASAGVLAQEYCL